MFDSASHNACHTGGNKHLVMISVSPWALNKGPYGNPRDCPIREKNPTKIFRETQTKPFTLSQIVQSEIFL